MKNQTTSRRVEFTVKPDYPIWLLGDSPSINYPDLPPLDPRHPTRHTIWTPILDVIQRHLFRNGCRLNDSELYIRNAVSDYKHKLEKPKELGKEIAEFQANQVKEMKKLRELLNRPKKPLLVLCFGQFAFEFARRAQEGKIEILLPKDWKSLKIPKLSKEFEARIGNVQLGNATLIPLLHASTALSFQDASRDFSGGGGNYFEYVGKEITDKLILHCTEFRLNELLLRVNQEGVAS